MTELVWSPIDYQRSAAFVSAFGAEVVDWLAPAKGERILDLGCGEGTLGLAIAAAGASVLGVDASPEMVAAARARGLPAEIASGEELPFEQEFDAVFSNAALHWMRRPDAVIAGVRRALKPGGRFVGEMGGFGNVAAIRAAMIAVARARGVDPSLADPWFFPTAEDYARRLTAGGFAVEKITLFARPTPLPDTGMEAWLMLFRAPFFAQFEAGAARQSAMADVVAALAPLRDPEGRWIADYVRLRFAARVAAASP